MPTTVYLNTGAIPAGQQGIVADSPAHAAAILRGDAPAPPPVWSSTPTATEARAGAAAAARARAMTSSIGGSIAFVNPNSLPGGKNNPGYIVARREWLKVKNQAEQSFKKYVLEELPPQYRHEAWTSPGLRADFLKRIRADFASKPIAHFKPDLPTLFAEAILQPFTKDGKIQTADVVREFGPAKAEQYFKDAGMKNPGVAVADAQRANSAQQILKKFSDSQTGAIDVLAAVDTLGAAEMRSHLRGLGYTREEARDEVKGAQEALRNNVLLKTGELVDKGFYISLPAHDQAFLRNRGIAAFEKKSAGEVKRAADVQRFFDPNPKLSASAADVQRYFATNAKVAAAMDRVAGGILNVKPEKVPVGIKTKMYDGLREMFSFGRVETPWRNQADVAKSYDIERAKLEAIYDGDSDKITKLYREGAYATKDRYDQDHEMAVETSKAQGEPSVGKNSYVVMALGTRKQYADAVMKSQPKLGELYKLWLPFEYVRPKRWKTLETWEKIVYPILDVAIIVPVVGMGARVSAGALKSTSLGAKIAAAGGKPALKQSLTLARQAVQKAELEVAAKTRMRNMIEQGLEDAVKRGAPKDAIQLQKGGQYAARYDVVAAKLELASLKGNLAKLQTLWGQAKGLPSKDIGAPLWKTSTGVQRVSAGASKPAGFAVSGIIGGVTIWNWDKLNNAERAVGLTLAGAWQVVPRSKGLLESALVPHKIPLKALAARGGALSEGGVPKISVAATGATGKKARVSVAEAMRQLTEGTTSRVEVPMGKGKKLKVRTTGFQRTVGPTALHASPSGEVFLKGGASYLERYLGKTSVRVGGTEGGLFTSYGLLHKFSHQSALGKKGGVPSGILVGVEKVESLPKAAAKKPTIQQIEKATMRMLNSERLSGRMIEGFKQYKGWMELENVAIIGTELHRVTNLRSRLAKKLHRNKGEYYTADKQGRIELVQMYIEGGRSTPYTLAELYKLKGNALRNGLEDLFYGLTLRRKSLLTSDTKKLVNVFTKEELLARMNASIRARLKAGKLSGARARALRSKLRTQVRRKYRPATSRAAVRAEIARVARAQGRTQSPRARLVRAFEGRQAAARLSRAAEARAQREGGRQPRAEGRSPAGGRELREGRPIDTRPVGDREPRPGPDRVPPDRPPRDRVPPPPDRPPRVPPPDRPPRVPPPDRPPRVPPEEKGKKRWKNFDSGGDEETPETMAALGRVSWNQGAFRVTLIPPSHTNKKATVVYDRIDPKSNVSRIPKVTLTKLGGKVPSAVTLGMGVFDARITAGKSIVFGRSAPISSPGVRKRAGARIVDSRGRVVASRGRAGKRRGQLI